MKNIILQLLVTLLLYHICVGQAVTPVGKFPILPYDTTQGAITSYAFYFSSDTDITDNASVQVIFPTEFDPRSLALFTGCLIQGSSDNEYLPVPCSVSYNSFTIKAGSITAGDLSVVVNGITNPLSSTISSQFAISTLFQTIQVTTNMQFGQSPFSAAPVTSSVGTVQNTFNTLIEQGSSWVFNFTPSQAYPANSSLRFIFPTGFNTNKIVCNVTGLFNQAIDDRVLPNGNIYDCLNINMALAAGTPQRVVISGVVNPGWELTASNFKVQILQGNGIIILETISVTGSQLISRKSLNLTLTYPNLFRNNSCVYTFQMNVQSNLNYGDYIKLELSGNWTFFLNGTYIIAGVNSAIGQTPIFSIAYNSTTSVLYLKNFSNITTSQPVTFYVSLMTPLLANNYNFVATTKRAGHLIVEQYTQIIPINATTAYIKQLRMHPVHQSIKLPVGQTGPLEIVLGLNYYLPNTNVLTYGKIMIEITPQIPLPPINLNGVPKCYFFGDTPAFNCTYDVSDSSKTLITIFTPQDFIFQSSEIPVMITTEGYIDPSYQGITIDTLVKRYLFKILFYASYNPPTIPTEVLFTEWIPDPITMNSVNCTSITTDQYEYSHLICTLTTPSIDLCANGHVHLFRIEFLYINSAWDYSMGWNQDTTYTDYPCLMAGTNLSAIPYVKCDLVTYHYGPYALQKSSPGPYVNIYGFSLLPGGSTLTIEIPNLKLGSRFQYTNIRFSINEETWGMRSPYVEMYSQTIYNLNYLDWNNGGYVSTTFTYSFSNPVINKNTTFSIGPFSVSADNPDYYILQLDQTAFPDIGRQFRFTCGSHICSKFNIPHQYFILYPQSYLGSSNIILTFPYIMTPAYAGTFTFYLRAFKSNDVVNKWSFSVVINPETLSAATFQFDSAYESTTTLYPNKEQFYKVSWTLKNPLPASTSSITVTFSGEYSITSSAYCLITTTVAAFDSRGIMCVVSSTNMITISNLAAAPTAATFTLETKLISTSAANTINPTISIATYYSSGISVDILNSQAHINNPISNTKLTTMASFNIANPQIILQKIRKGYFGPLQFYFFVTSASTASNGYYTLFTLTNDYNPVGSVLNLPLVCNINSNRYPCSYSLNPLSVTITHGTSVLTTGNISLYINTDMQEPVNGFYHPISAGRFMSSVEVQNWIGSTLEKGQYYFDILPDDMTLFNASFAHRDTSKPNLYTFNLRTGSTVVPAYNDPSNAGRVYIGFPTADAFSATVFDNYLGFSSSGMGTILPCWFNNGSGYVLPIAGQSLACRLRSSSVSPTPVWVEIMNFQSIPALGNMQIIMGKILNPSSITVDVNFVIKITTINPVTQVESPLYETMYNMFFDMRSPSIINSNEVNSSTTMFQPGSNVGDTNKYITITPYTPTAFASGDWFILDLDPNFQLTTTVDNCLSGFYLNCIVFPTVNWLAVQIGNGTIIPLYPHIVQLPLSISRLDTTYLCYNFISNRWSNTITYTITAAYRWMEIQGSITNFMFSVTGRQEKINALRTQVQVLIGFKTTHLLPANGCIEIKFPANSTLVPSIKTHCRSAVTMGSALNGQNTGNTAPNVQGEIGCYVQNTYSWIITGNDVLAAGSQVYISGVIDMPLVTTNSLGTGYIVTYLSDDPTNTFANSRIIDYMSASFLLNVNTTTWYLDESAVTYQTTPLKTGFVGDLKFLVRTANAINANDGYVQLFLYTQNQKSSGTGFVLPTNPVCIINKLTTNQKIGCAITTSSGTPYISYILTPFEILSAATDYIMRITTQNNNANEGIIFPTSLGVYKAESLIHYVAVNPTVIYSNTFYLQVYGGSFNTLNFYSTVTLPGEKNLIMVEVTPSTTIATNQQLVIEIPTQSNDGTNYFNDDLGMGYTDYSNLVFDIYDSTSGISSMTCKVYCGQQINGIPVKIICSNFNTALTSANIVKFGFWVTNPSVTRSLAIPVTIYSFDQYAVTKNNWNILESGFNVIVTSALPILDQGNFAFNTPVYQTNPVYLSLTTRNSAPLLNGDLYIVKVGFDPRQKGLFSSGFIYNVGLGSTGTLYILQNCMTYVLKVGATSLTTVLSASLTINAQINNIFTPYWKPSTAESVIIAYASYLSSGTSEKITHKDSLPTMSPKELSIPSFSFTALSGNTLAGQLEDYQFDFTYVSGGSSGDMAFAKMFSITFPNSTTNDFGFVGTECTPGINSGIQIASCVIDTSNHIIWITPIVKSTYTTGTPLSIQTRNLAIKNPAILLSVDAKSFEVRVYTWNTVTQPILIASSLNYVYLRQMNNIASSVTTYTSSGVPSHTQFSMTHRRTVNHFQPSNNFAGVSMKTPFRFKFKSVATFTNQTSSSSNYHIITLNYGSSYTYTSSGTLYDMLQYVPACYLNEVRIQSCTISGNTITMKFLQPLTSTQEVSLMFTVLNPLDEQDSGFIYTAVNTGSYFVTLTLKPYALSGGSTYYIETDPFHPYYRTPSGLSTYPHFGITAATLYVGTYVQSSLNLLEFQFTFSRSDINGLIIEIPNVDMDGSTIYSNPVLLNLPSGSKIPCSVGQGFPVNCYYEAGDLVGYGTPTRIYVSQFTSGNALQLRLLITNPDNVGSWPSINVRAVGGSISAPSIFGNELMGRWSFNRIFKTLLNNNTFYQTTTDNSNSNPTLPLYQSNTLYQMYNNYYSLPANSYGLLIWSLSTITYGQIADYIPDATGTYGEDYFVVNYGTSNRTVYILKKYTSGVTIPADHTFGYIRQKHFLYNNQTLYLFSNDGCTRVISYTIPNSVQMSSYSVNYGSYTLSIKSMDLETRQTGVSNNHYLSIDITNLYNNIAQLSNDPADMVLAMQFDSGALFSSLGTACSIHSGVTSSDPLITPYCTLTYIVSRYQFIIRNFNKFSGTTLNLYYSAVNAGSNPGTTSIILRLYANSVAFNNLGTGNPDWPIAYLTASYTYTYMNYYYSSGANTASQSYPSYSTQLYGTSSGTISITSISSSSISFIIYANTQIYTANNYYYLISLFVERVTFSSSCTSSFGSCSIASNHQINIQAANFINWPVGTYSVTVSVSISGLTIPYESLSAHGEIMLYTNQYYTDDCVNCGTGLCCCDYWGYYSCCNISCYRYFDWVVWFFSSVSSYLTQTAVFTYSAPWISVQSNQLGVETEFSFGISSVLINIGPSYGNYLMIYWTSGTWSNNNQFIYTYTNQTVAQVDCKCVVAASILISYSTSYTDTNCYRMLPNNGYTSPLIRVEANIPNGQSIQCFFPGFFTSSSATMNAVFQVVDTRTPREYPSQYYTYYSNNAASSIGTNSNSNNSGFTFLETPSNFLISTTIGGITNNTNGNYQLSLTASTTFYQPYIYISYPAPVPAQTWCSNSSFILCRVYTSYINRMYFIVAQSSSTSISQIVLNSGSAPSLPNSRDYLSTNLNVYAAWSTTSAQGNYYYYRRTITRDLSALSPKTPSIGLTSSLFGTNLATLSSTLTFSVPMSGMTLYGWTKRAAWVGSYASLVISSTAINGCAVWVTDNMNLLTNAIFCTVNAATNTITITTKADLSSSGTLYLAIQVTAIPSSYTATFTLYDKWRGASDYSVTISNSASFGRSVTGYTIMKPSYIIFRRQAYKQLRTDISPIVYRFSNSLDYVYNETSPTSSHSLIVYYPASSGISIYTYYCFLREYTSGSYELYNEWQPSCNVYPTIANQVQVWAIPGHIMRAGTNYQVIIYKIDNANSIMFPVPSGTTYNTALYSYSGTSLMYQSQLSMRSYQSVNPITISKMYILTREAGVSNSLFLTFSIGTAGTSAQQIEFKFANLGLSNFHLNSGQELPCYIGTGFSLLSGMTAVRCIATSSGINQDTPLYIRVINIATFTSGNPFSIAFDGFTNPAMNSLLLTSMDMTITFVDLTTKKIYTSFFPEIYTSDSININSNPTDLSATYYTTNNTYGASTSHYLTFNWPQVSSNTVSEKTMVIFQGGIVCCVAVSSLTFNAQSTNFPVLWANTKANIVVLATPSLSTGSTNFKFTGVVNPYPYQVSTYNITLQIETVIYKNYQRVAVDYTNQPAWASYGVTANSMTLSGVSTIYHKTSTNQFHNNFLVTYDFTFSFTATDFVTRKVTYCLVKFTAGVGQIDAAYSWIPGISPYYINNVENIKFYYGGSNWMLNITGLNESNIATTQTWNVRLRFYPTGNTISYTSTSYCYNGIVEFTNTGSSTSPSTDGYNNSNQAATSFYLAQRRYLPNNYQLMIKKIQPIASSSTNRLIFRFTAAYNVSQAESFSIVLPTSSSTGSFVPKNTPNNLICVINPTYRNKTDYGVGYYTTCTYSTYIYTVKAPSGGLIAGNEYSISIMEANQLTSGFYMPTSPMRQQVVFIYNSMVGLQYSDVYVINYPLLFNIFSVVHSTLLASTASYTVRNTLSVSFNPAIAVSAATLTGIVTECMLVLEVPTRYFSDDLNIPLIFTNQGSSYTNGQYYTHLANPSVATASTRFMKGQRSYNYTASRFSVTDYGGFSTATTYTFKFPLITHPIGDKTPLMYKLSLLFINNNVTYPIVMGTYNYQNLNSLTATGTLGKVTATFTATNAVVQNSAMAITFVFTSFIMPSGYELVIKLNNNNRKAWTSIANLASPIDANYSTYEYYPNLNLLRIFKTNGNTDYSVSMNTFPTSIDVQSWGFTFAYVQASTTYYDGNFSNSPTFSSAISAASSWSTLTLTRASGLANYYVVNQYTLSWSSILAFPEGSYMLITFSGLQVLSPLADQCKSISGFPAGILSTSVLLCKRQSNSQIIVTGYGNIAATTVLSLTTWLKNPGLSNEVVTISATSSAGNLIISGSANPINISSSYNGLSTLSLKETTSVSLYSQTTTPMTITFTLSSYTLVSATNDYIYLNLGNWTVGTPTAEGRVLWKYKMSSWVYWVPVTVTQTGSWYQIPIYSNYSMTPGTLISISISDILPQDFNGVKVSNPQYNYFTVQAWKNAALVEQQVLKLWIPPIGQNTFTVTPALTYLGATSLYTFTMTPNVNVVAGDVISVQFTTNDRYYTFFDNALGKSFTDNSFNIGCRQLDGNTLISNSRITCELFKGSSATQKPAIIKIPVTKSITAGTLLTFIILDITNPASNNNIWVGITGRVLRVCDYGDPINMCSIYDSIYYMQFVTGWTPGFSGNGWLSANPSIVSSTPSVHTVSNGFSLQSGDYMMIIYYPEVIVPGGCTVTGHSCWTFPIENVIIIKITSTIASPFSLGIQNMTNLYKQYSSNLYTEIYRSGGMLGRFYSTYSYSAMTTDLTSGTALGIAFTPTLTSNNYELNINFNNIARLDISYLYQNGNIQSFWLVPPGGQINLINTYCNATLESLPSEQTPYPYRFICTFYGGGWYQSIQLTMPSTNFPAWDSSFINRNIVVYLQYNINSGLGANDLSNWYVTAYANVNQNYNDMVAQGVGLFTIAPYRSPPISSVDFHTTSFNSRTCTTNDKCEFYGYLLPSTDYNSYQITKMVFTLPPEFGYAAITSLDSCLMVGYSNININSCLIDRTNSTLTITYVPSSYDHNYKLITLNTANYSQLFTSPAYPGSHYQMRTDLYTVINGKDVLIETTRVNLTTVYGSYLSVPDIVAKIPLDASSYGLFDIQFLVGSLDIPPSYPSTSANAITSRIVLVFANSFDFDLGTGYSAGDTVACVPVSGLTFNTMNRITCQITPSSSSTTYPTVRISGYDKISNGSTVRFKLAGLKTLPVGIIDDIEVGVELVYYNYGGVTGNLYEPTSVIVGPTTAAITPYSINFVVTENSTNTVGELANYTFSGTIGTGFSPVTTSDYLVVQFPIDSFERSFSINSQAICSIATSQRCNSFSKASLIYFYPASTLSSTALSFNINNMIQAAYQFNYINVTFTVFTVVNNKVNAKGTATMIKFAKPSKNLSAIITSIDSSYGGDSQINYYFQFQLNHLLPTNGAITITFPTVYPTLFYLSAQCLLQGGLLSSSLLPYCTIASEYQINIYPNGILLDSASTYTLTITNITNPNQNLSNYTFIASSYYDSNIYSQHIISQGTFSPPQINLITVKSCTFQTTLTATNAGIQTKYSFVLICPSYIKQASQVKVYLPWRPALGQINCSSNTGSLYSYQCQITQEFVGSQNYTYLSVLVRTINAQKLFEFETILTNPASGNYTLTTAIGYRGSIFLNGSTSVYVSALTFNSSNIPIALTNYPQNAGESAIYVFKLPFIVMSNSPTVFTVTFPPVFNSFSELSCKYQISSINLNFSYVQLRLNQSTNSLSCTSSGSVVTFSNISTVFATASTSSSYFYYIVYGVINPSVFGSSNFTLTYQTSTTVYWTNTQMLSYYITSTPPYMQINKVNTSLPTYLVQTDYEFRLTLPAAINIPSATPLALEINFPSVYVDVWDRMPLNSTITLTLGSSSSTAYANLSAGSLYASFNITASTTFSTVDIIVSPWRNPSNALNCSQTPIFHISLYDYKFNNVITSTVLNNKDCVLFTSRLYSVQVEGNSVIYSGSMANYTIILQQPASFLNITPTTTSSAISFEPSSIVFSNYSTNFSTFVIKAASSLTGNYTIHFAKTEGLASPFYNDVADMNITVVAPIIPYYINFTSVDTKSIGIPIIIPITLSPQSSNSFTLFYSHNCSTNYILTPSNSLLISAGVNLTNISITYKGSVVPPLCAITFSLSYSNYNYQLTNQTLYVAGYLSNDRTSVIPIMRMSISPSPMNSSDVGKTILISNNSQAQLLKPIVYSIIVSESRSNSANFSVILTEIGTLYYVIVPAGAPETIQQSNIKNASTSQMITSGSSIAQQSINIVSNFQVTGLSSQSQYKLAAYLSSSVGDSDIVYIRFNTTQSSNGAELVIALTSIQPNSTVLMALSNILRIPVSRMAVLTFSTTLVNYSTTYNSSIMNQRNFVYSIVIAPNPANQTIAPIDIANNLKNNNDTQTALAIQLPSFNMGYSIYTREVVAAKPRVSKNPQIPILRFDSMTITMSFWEEAYVYAVILPTPSPNLLSNQVISGLDYNNNPVLVSQYVSTQTNVNGSVEFSFIKLNGNTSYVVHISAQCVLPYTPRLAMTDSEVIHLPLMTFPNLNLRSTQAQLLAVLNSIDPSWGQDVNKHIQENQLKTSIQKKTKAPIRVVNT